MELENIPHFTTLHKFFTRFEKEINVSLSGISSGWQDDAITVLADTCDYLISVRGFERWEF